MSANQTKSSDHDFGRKLQELESITEWFESDDIDLNAALAKFERGMQLAGELKQELDQVENRVEKIKAKFDATDAGAAGIDAPVADFANADPDLFSQP